MHLKRETVMRSWWLRYGAAIVTIALATLLRWPLVAAFGELPVFMLVFPAVCLLAITLGPGATALATVLSVVAAFFFIPPTGRLHLARSTDIISAVVALSSGAIMSVMSAMLTRSRARLVAAAARHGAQRERELAAEFLRLINQSSGTRQLIQTAMHFFKVQSDCEAVGIRLREGDDFPYYEVHGFPAQFVRLENSICVRDSDGRVLRDEEGNPVLACMCGNVIGGRFDASKPFFTAAGSFWSNDTTQLLAGAAEAERQGHTRDRCAVMGYQSVALIRLGVGEDHFGLLQLNDRRKNRFTPDMVELWEKLAGYLAVALAKTRAEEALRSSEEKFSRAFSASPNAMVISRLEDGTIRDINESGLRLIGRQRHEVLGKRSRDLGIYVDAKDRDRSVALLKQHGKLRDYELRFSRPSGEIRQTLLAVEPIQIAGEMLILSVVRDITEQKQAAGDQELAADLLRAMNRGMGDLHGLINEVLGLIRKRTGLDAVGLRLRDGDDCPYYQQDGFSDDFLREENFLCAKGADGSIVRDASGKAILECTCGLVLGGRTDPTMPCFTRGGSFWTNRSAELLSLAPESDPRENPRNRCIHAGYQSVALIPVRAKDLVIGLLQLNARLPDRFTPERILLFEGIANSLGLALQRRQTEESLRQSEERLRMAQGIGRIGSFDWDIVNDRLQGTPELLSLYGLTTQQFGGTSADWRRRLHPDDLPRIEQSLHKAMNGGGTAEDEFRIIWPDGSVHWVFARGSVTLDVNGKPARMVGVNQDITIRKTAEQALVDSESRYRRLMQAIPVPLGVMNSSGESVYFNDRFTQVFGYTQADLPTLDAWWQKAYPEAGYRQRVIEHWRTKMRQAAHNRTETPPEEFNVTCKDGTVRVVVITNLTIEDYILASFMDITERKRAEDALRESEHRYRGIVETAEEGIAAHEPDGTITYINQRMAYMLGYSREEVIGKSSVDFVDEAHRDAVIQAREGTREQGSFSKEWKLRRKDGSTLWTLVNVSPRRDDNGELLGYLAMHTDITALKQTVEELNAARLSAEQARATAEEANKAKDHFLAVLSHELRTPLTAVLPALEELRETVPQEAREDIEMAVRNVELEARLIEDLLDITRIARGKIELHREMVDLQMTVQRAAEVCASDIEARRLQFGIKVEGGPFLLHGDSARLQQVFWNLIKNAVKFTAHDGCVGIACYGDGDGHVKAEVSDNGLGIEPDALPRIFNAFEQVDRTVTQRFGGLGLGLAISKALVEMHGGTIAVHSKGRGKGATFTVKLPIHKPAGGESSAAIRPESAAQHTAAASPVRILLVEDHGDTSKIMSRLLRSRGQHVETAGDVATALDLVRSGQFDLLISDLGLPDRSGVELMQELRRAGNPIRGIALSGFGQEADVSRSLAAGFAEHLVKPVNTRHLEAAIERVMARSSTP